MGGFQNDSGVLQQESGFGFLGRFFTESFNPTMTAKPSGTQANSTPIDSMFCTFTTVASAGDGGLLPAVGAFPGGALIICVVNATANPMTVFAQGTDTINGQAGATGVTQMGSSIVYYQCTAAGKWLAVGLGAGFATGNSASFPTFAPQDAITATPSGTQTTSLLITGSNARIATVASAGDGVRLPPAIAGMEITLVNDAAANAANVFPASAANGGVSGGDKINTGAQNAAFSLAAVNGAGAGPTLFICYTTGTWRTK